MHSEYVVERVRESQNHQELLEIIRAADPATLG
jgi:hypothetical protein